MTAAASTRSLLAGLDDEHARIDLAGQRHEVGIGELSPLLVWRICDVYGGRARRKVKPLSVGYARR